jgi:hypothetical protein
MLAAIVQLVATAFQAVLAYLQKKREDLLVSLGASKERGDGLQGRLDGIQEAKKLEDGADAHAQRNPDDWMSDDGFRRKDDE